jgi:hypothetical protein
VTTAAEYRSYARECFESARAAPSDEVSLHFLEIAKLWLMAAAKLDGANMDREILDAVSAIATQRQSGVASRESGN